MVMMRRIKSSWLLFLALILYLVGLRFAGESKAIGRVLTYKDIYLTAPLMSAIVLIFGEIVLKKADEIKYMIFGECLLGCLLLSITTTDKAIPTILYWVCVVIIGYCYKRSEDERKGTT